MSRGKCKNSSICRVTPHWRFRYVTSLWRFAARAMQVRHQLVAFRRASDAGTSPGCGVSSRERCRYVTRLWRYAARAMQVRHQVVALRRTGDADPSPACNVASSRDLSASPERRVASRSRTICLASGESCVEVVTYLPRQWGELRRGRDLFASPVGSVASRS